MWFAVERKWVNAGTDFGENFARFALDCCQVGSQRSGPRGRGQDLAPSRALSSRARRCASLSFSAAAQAWQYFPFRYDHTRRFVSWCRG